MAWSLWWVYLLASVGLSLTPGPNSLLVLAHGALHGRRRTLWTITGGSLGFALLIGLSMLGIGALLRASADALVLLKWGGGAYLVWLGIQLWRAPPLQLDMPEIDGQHGPVRRSVMFRQGLLAAISNPKALLFYGAFLPQFIEPGRSLWLQYVVMAGTFCMIECVVEFGLASLAHRVRPWLRRVGRRFNQGCGVLFAVMGAVLPLTN